MTTRARDDRFTGVMKPFPLPEFSVRNRSISLTSAGDNCHEAAPINWLSCPGFLAPTIAADGSHNVQTHLTSC